LYALPIYFAGWAGEALKQLKQQVALVIKKNGPT